MIIVKAPLRISLIGGGTDKPEYYERYGGRSIACTIDKDVSVRYLPNESLIINGKPLTPDSLLAHICKELGIDRGDYHIYSELPYGMGLGSSSALTVAFVKLVRPDLDPFHAAEFAYEIEKSVTGGGKQDPYAISFGGLTDTHFGADGSVTVNHMAVESLYDFNFMLFKVGERRNSANYIDRWDLEKLHGYAELTESACHAIVDCDFEGLAYCINEAMSIKRSVCDDIITDQIDAVLDIGLENGAVAGRLIGAGGSGHVLFMCEPGRQGELVRSLEFMAKHVYFDWR